MSVEWIEARDKDSNASGLYLRHMTTVSLNLSSTDEGGGGAGGYTLAESILIAIFLSLIIFFSIAGNILVCVAVLTERNLRKTSNLFIVSLAVSDTLVAILVMTFAVVNDLMGRWVFGAAFCKIWLSFDVMCSTASILNLCAISLDRYIHIRSPLHYDMWMSTRRTLGFIAFVWVLSLLISFFPIQMGWHETTSSTNIIASNSPSLVELEPFICLLELNLLYAVISSIVSFYVPCLVMILIYVRLYRYARMHVKMIRQQQCFIGESESVKQKTSDHKAAITLGIIMGVFLLCWTPFFTINIIGAFCKTCIPPAAFSAFTWLGYFNSTLNPLIYSIFNQEFRVAFKHVLSRTCCLPRRRRPANYCLRKSAPPNGLSPSAEYGTLTLKRTSYQVIKGNHDSVIPSRALH